MRPVLDHCDAEGWPAYLESSKERNIPFYARHGFAVVEEVPLPARGPEHLDDVAGPQAPQATGRGRQAPVSRVSGRVDTLGHGRAGH